MLTSELMHIDSLILNGSNYFEAMEILLSVETQNFLLVTSEGQTKHKKTSKKNGFVVISLCFV